MTTLFDYVKCTFLDDEWTCDECIFKLNGTCTEQFYKKYGRHRDGNN
jgi:hypothetical protein